MRKKLLSLSLIVAMIFNIALMNIPLAVSADENEVAFDYENYSIDYAVDTTYGNTQAIQITITNTGDEIIENWMLAYDDFYGEVSEIWNGIVATTENGKDYIRNVGYNANIQPDSSVSFGYSLIDFTGTPSSIIMCQDRVTKESGYTAELNVVSEWGTAFNGEIILSNTTDNPIEWWEFTFDSNFTITEVTTSWAASVVDNGDGNYTFKGTYTGIVAPNSNVTLGFQAIKNGTPEIDNTSLTEVKFIEETEIDIETLKEAEKANVEALNVGSEYTPEILEHENGIVYSIDGKFSSILVTDEISALQALYNVKTLLGISNPSTDLISDGNYESEIGDFTSYFFNQIYNNIPVYGRSVTVVAMNDGETLSLDSNFINIVDINTIPLVTISEIETEYGVDNATLSIYSFDEYETAPVSMPTIETTSTTDDSLIDIVLMFQVYGHVESSFEEQKAMILSLSEAVFTTFPNARIYVLAVEDDGAEFLKDEDDNDFFTAESSMVSVENASFTQYDDYTNWNPAFQKIIDLDTNNSFRENVPKYLYRIAYSSGFFGSPNQLDMTDIPGAIYSEFRYGLVYDDNFAAKVLGVSIDTNGICIMYDNNSAQIVYDHICDNIQYVEPIDTQIRLGLNWENLNLSTPITMGGTSDNDDDGLTDWEELDSEFLSSYWEENKYDVIFVKKTRL
ncbi:MAG: cellulose binding domain-containing protein [Oscillospiraceae bacterium]|jgi:hypothetical protein|nr:cellulose binding domain-containing protein [Oscillospiraceae bacterium]